MDALNTVADRQAAWSVTANRLKDTVNSVRWMVFGLLLLGALFGAIAGQMNAGGPLLSDPRTWVAIAAAIALMVATFLTQRLLNMDRLTAWVRSRAISEALKREAYKFAAGADPYADAQTSAAALDSEREKIEKDGEDLIGQLAINAGQGSVPRQLLSHEEYVKRRVDGQITFYRQRAAQYRKTAGILRAAEFSLALIAMIVTAVSSVTGKHGDATGFHFDLAALTAVLTTVAGAILAHVEASRLDYLITSYLAAARQLEDRKCRPPEPWSAFVNDCETILAAENSSWIAKWSKARPGEA